MADRRAQLDGGGAAVTASTPLLAHGSNPINGTSDGGAGVDAGVDGVGDSGAAGVGLRAAGRRRQSAVSKAASRQSGGSVGRKSVPRRRASKKELSRLSAAENAEARVVTDVDVEVACMYLKDAQHGRRIGYCVDENARRVYRFFHARWWVFTYLCVACFNMALVMLETPTVPSYLWVGPGLPVALEIGCILVYLADLSLLYRFFHNGYQHTLFWCHKWSLVRVIVVSIMVIDVTLYVSSGYTSVQFSRPLRPLMLIARTRNVRQVFLGCLITLYRILPMFLLVAFHIIFFAFLGNVIFGSIATPALFRTLPDSMLLLWRTTTSISLNLQIIIDYWHTTAGWCAVFISVFVIVGNLILFKLFIAASFRSYKRYTRRKTMARIKLRRTALNAAFKLLAVPSTRRADVLAVPKAVWFRVMRRLRPKLKGVVLDVMFSAVDTRGDDEVPVRPFMNLCALINVTFKMHPDIEGWPRLNVWRRMGRVFFNYSVWVAGERLIVSDIAIGLLVTLSAVQMYKETELSHEAHPDAAQGDMWHAIGVVTLLLFIAEGALRALCFGVKRYFDSYFHRLDALCNTCGTVYFAMVGVTPADGQAATLRLVLNVVLIFRLLRLLKLLAVFSPTKKIVWTLQRVAPSMGRLLFIIVAVLYVFAIIGVEAFAAAHGPKGFVDELTFHSFPAAMLTLFEMSLLAMWPAVMAQAQAKTNKWAQVYFYLYHVVGVMLLIPVFIGFIVESFVSNYAQVEAEFQKEASEVRERYQVWLAERMQRKARRQERSRRASKEMSGRNNGWMLTNISVDSGAAPGTVGTAGVDGSTVGGSQANGIAAAALVGGGAGTVVSGTVATGSAAGSVGAVVNVAASAASGASGYAGGSAQGDATGGSGGNGGGSDSDESLAFNYEVEAAVEMAIKRRTSDINYVLFDIHGALQQADYEQLVERNKAQVALLARRQERIRHMASQLVLFASDNRRLKNELRALRESVEQGDRQATQQSHGTRAPNSRPPRHRFGLDGTAAGAVPVPKRRPTQPAPRSTGRRMFAASNARSSELQTGAAFLDALGRSQGSVGAGAPPPQQHTPPHHHEQQQQQQQQLDPSAITVHAEAHAPYAAGQPAPDGRSSAVDNADTGVTVGEAAARAPGQLRTRSRAAHRAPFGLPSPVPEHGRSARTVAPASVERVGADTDREQHGGGGGLRDEWSDDHTDGGYTDGGHTDGGHTDGGHTTGGDSDRKYHDGDEVGAHSDAHEHDTDDASQLSVDMGTSESEEDSDSEGDDHAPDARVGMSSVVTGGGAGLGMMVAGHESLWQDEAVAVAPRGPVPIIAAQRARRGRGRAAGDSDTADGARRRSSSAGPRSRVGRS